VPEIVYWNLSRDELYETGVAILSVSHDMFKVFMEGGTNEQDVVQMEEVVVDEVKHAH